jgi:hypothetical protein
MLLSITSTQAFTENLYGMRPRPELAQGIYAFIRAQNADEAAPAGAHIRQSKEVGGTL